MKRINDEQTNLIYFNLNMNSSNPDINYEIRMRNNEILIIETSHVCAVLVFDLLLIYV